MKHKFDDWEMDLSNVKAKAPSGTYKHQYQLINDRVVEIKEITVYTFSMGDVEDPDLLAAEPMWKWQESEMGKWVMKHAVETPVWHRFADMASFGHRYVIRAKLTGKDLTFFYLKWKDAIDRTIK